MFLGRPEPTERSGPSASPRREHLKKCVGPPRWGNQPTAMQPEHGARSRLREASTTAEKNDKIRAQEQGIP
jgi:hypothetical protein